MNIKNLIVFILNSLIFACLLASPAWAAGSLYLSPAAGSYPVGSTLVVSVRVTSGGDAINAVSAYVAYPTDTLDFAWVGESGSIFSIWAEKIGGAGLVKMSGGRLPPPFTGDGQVGSIGFIVKKTGTASLSFASGSHIVTAASNSDIYSGGAGASFTLTAAEPTTASLSTSASPTPTPFAISAVSAVPASTSATISWQTTKLSDSTVEFGLQPGKYIMTASSKEKTLSHTINLLGLTPATTFYFVAKSMDASGNITTSREGTFTTSSPPLPSQNPSNFNTIDFRLLAIGVALILIVLGTLGIFIWWR